MMFKKYLVVAMGCLKKTVLGKRKSTNPVDSYFAPRTTLGAQPGLKVCFKVKKGCGKLIWLLQGFYMTIAFLLMW